MLEGKHFLFYLPFEAIADFQEGLNQLSEGGLVSYHCELMEC